MYYFISYMLFYVMNTKIRLELSSSAHFAIVAKGGLFLTEHCDVITIDLWRLANAKYWYCDVHIHRLSLHAQIGAKAIFYSERPRGAGFRSVNPAERWRENPARALARAGFSQHLECGIHRSESSPEGSFTLIPRAVARWAKTTP